MLLAVIDHHQYAFLVEGSPSVLPLRGYRLHYVAFSVCLCITLGSPRELSTVGACPFLPHLCRVHSKQFLLVVQPSRADEVFMFGVERYIVLRITQAITLGGTSSGGFCRIKTKGL